MSLFLVLIIAIIALVASIVIAITFKFSISSLKSKFLIIESQLQVNELLLSEMKHTIDNLQSILDENAAEHCEKSTESEQVIKQLEYRIQSLQSDFLSLQEQTKHSLEQQPEDKLYSRAFKLAAKGADLEEIISECELPRAEAEMLLSLYKANQN